MIEQQRAFAKQMLKAASKGQEMVTNADDGTSGSPLSSIPDIPSAPPATSSEASQPLPDAEKGTLKVEDERPARSRLARPGRATTA
jgi:hypothetical protein